MNKIIKKSKNTNSRNTLPPSKKELENLPVEENSVFASKCKNCYEEQKKK